MHNGDVEGESTVMVHLSFFFLCDDGRYVKARRRGFLLMPAIPCSLGSFILYIVVLGNVSPILNTVLIARLCLSLNKHIIRFQCI